MTTPWRGSCPRPSIIDECISDYSIDQASYTCGWQPLRFSCWHVGDAVHEKQVRAESETNRMCVWMAIIVFEQRMSGRLNTSLVVGVQLELRILDAYDSYGVSELAHHRVVAQ